MKRTVLIYGLIGGAMIVALKLTEYRFLVVENSLEIYGGLVAFLFAALGIWLGVKMSRSTERVVIREVVVLSPSDKPFEVNSASVERFGLTPRELEILGLIAEGLSNREIAQRVFVSENTVKTHSAKIFLKLNARRRTQAVQIGKEARLIP